MTSEYQSTTDFEDLKRKAEALSSTMPLRVPDPVMSNQELSESIGNITMRIESLCKDVAALEAKIVAGPKSRLHRAKVWLAAKISAPLMKFILEDATKP